MKRTTTATGFLTLLAMLVLGAFSAGSASAVSQFLWTGPLPALGLVLSENTQFFKAVPGGTPAVTCKHFGGHGIVSNGKAMTTKEITITGQYSKCETLGIATKVTPAEFLLNADGSVSVVGKPIVISIGGVANCSLKIETGPSNENLKTIKFLQDALNAGAITAHVEIKGITSLGSGGECGTAGLEQKEGEYRGLLLASVDGGTIRWDP